MPFPAYKKVRHLGRDGGVQYTDAAGVLHGFALPLGLDPEQDAAIVANADYQRYLLDVAAGATVAAADPEPIVYAGRQDIEYRAQTIGATPGEVVRFTLTTLTGYSASVEVIGIDAGNGVMKRLLFASTFKRLNGGAVGVGTRTDLASHQDGGAAGTTAGVANWTITPSIDGNDAVISVAGASGRTVDWFAFVTLRRFRPGGL